MPSTLKSRLPVVRGLSRSPLSAAAKPRRIHPNEQGCQGDIFHLRRHRAMDLRWSIDGNTAMDLRWSIVATLLIEYLYVAGYLADGVELSVDL